MRVVVLLNPGGGTLSRGAIHPAEVAVALRQAGLPAEVRAVRARLLPAATREALASGAELVIAGGGDGTVSAVAGALAGSDAALGVLPLGTFNHYARDLGMPEELHAAAAALAAATPRCLDLAEVNGHRFINNSSLGFATQVVRERAEPRIRTRITKAWVTLVAALRLLGRYRLSEVCLDVDGRRVEYETPFVFISNNPADMPFFYLGRRPRLDTGLLMVYVHRSKSRSAVLGTLLYSLLRDVREAARFDQWTTTEALVEFPLRRRPVAVFLDGELLHLSPPLRYRILPGRLKVAVPPPAAVASPAPARCRRAAG
ncbi:MAG TPA: diacylglycerol kinase family protein [Thermoanaerobaculia bacterium]|nr:diacylglycerol kinase family protein [Thermoanaerobaculia bacterium]